MLTHSHFFFAGQPPLLHPIQPAHWPLPLPPTWRPPLSSCQLHQAHIWATWCTVGVPSFTLPLSLAHIDRRDPPKPPDGHKRQPGSHAARAPHIGVLFPPRMEFVVSPTFPTPHPSVHPSSSHQAPFVSLTPWPGLCSDNWKRLQAYHILNANNVAVAIPVEILHKFAFCVGDSHRHYPDVVARGPRHAPHFRRLK